MFRSRRVWIVAVLAAALLLPAAYWYRQRQRYQHFAAHDRGMVYRAGRLEPDLLSELIETHQFRTVVGLCERGESGEERWTAQRHAVEQAGATWILMPFSAAVEVDDSPVPRAIDILRNPDNYPILVHSRHGVALTAKFLVMYDVLFRGMSAQNSLQRLSVSEQNAHDGNVRIFAQEFERRHGELYPTASADDLKILR